MALFIVILSIIPGKKFPDTEIEFADLIVHFGMYGTWVLVYYLELKRQLNSDLIRSLFLGTIVITLLGGLLEFIQEYFIEDRYGAWSDAFANLAGSVIVFLCLTLWHKRNLKLL